MKPASVDAYIAAQPELARPSLERVRAAIRRALPEAEEIISYQIPAYRLPKGTAIFFAGWKKHWSLYPAGKEPQPRSVRTASYEVNEKGTIRFPLKAEVPEDLIERIAAFRRSELG